MVVQVTPTAWTARCSEHGKSGSDALSAEDLSVIDAAHVRQL
jgi:hypothetical protein